MFSISIVCIFIIMLVYLRIECLLVFAWFNDWSYLADFCFTRAPYGGHCPAVCDWFVDTCNRLFT